MSKTIVTTLPFNITSTGVTSGGYSISSPLTITDKGLTIIGPLPATTSANYSFGSGGTYYFDLEVTGLTASSTYQIHAYMVDSGGTTTGKTFTFKTLASDKEVNTCIQTTVDIPIGMTYVLPQGAEILSAELTDTETVVPLGALDSSCIDTSIIPQTIHPPE